MGYREDISNELVVGINQLRIPRNITRSLMVEKFANTLNEISVNLKNLEATAFAVNNV